MRGFEGRKSIIRAAIAVASLASSRAAIAQLIAPPAGQQWKTTWSTEFNSGASDLNGWTYDVGAGGWGNNEFQTYTAPVNAPASTANPFGLPGRQSTPPAGMNSNNVFVSTDATTGTGALTIRAIGTQSGPNVNYTSGRIKTGPSTSFFSQTYGLFEIRAKFPAGNGLWPALWMMPKDMTYGGWPTSGEIDIYEGKGQDTGHVQSTIHSGPDPGSLNSQGRTFAQSGLRPAGFTVTDWHTYSFKWDDGPGTGAGALTFYVDGVAYHTINGGWTVPGGQPGSAPYDRPFYFILNLAVGGNYVGNLHPGAGTYDMNVDFVRAYSGLVAPAAPAWGVDASGNWSGYTNWQGQVVPNAIGAIAQFGSAINQARTVTVDTPIVAGQLLFDDAQSYSIGGSQTLTLNTSGAPATVTVQQCSHAINAPLTLARGTVFTVTPANQSLTLSLLQPSAGLSLTKNGAGSMFVNNLRTGGVTVNAGTVAVTAGGTTNSASRIGTLTFAGGASSPTAALDLSDNDLMVTTTSRTAIESSVRAARNGGSWNGAGGITSSAARGEPSNVTGLGILSGQEYIAFVGPGATLGGFTVAPTDTLVKYTWNGDANFDGTITFDDYVQIDVGFNGHLTGWANGDFDYSGGIDFDDYVMIDVAFNAQSGTLSRALDYLDGTDRSSSGVAGSPAMKLVVEHFEQFGLPYAQQFLASVPEPSAAIVALITSITSGFSARRRVRSRPTTVTGGRK